MIVVSQRICMIIDVDMNNQTKSSSARGYLVSLGHLAPMFSLLFILVIILTILFVLFVKQRDTVLADESELRSDVSVSVRERKSIRGESVRQYSSTGNSQERGSINIDINELNARSTMNLLAVE